MLKKTAKPDSENVLTIGNQPTGCLNDKPNLKMCLLGTTEQSTNRIHNQLSGINRKTEYLKMVNW